MGRSSQLVVEGEPDDGHPAVVAITNAEGVSTCSGTLIDDRAVLTAAHCGVRRGNLDDMRVFFGSDVMGSGTFLEIADVEVHPDYAEGDASHDLAVILLDSVGPAHPIPLPAVSFDGTASGATLELVGFGSTSIEGGDGGRKRRGTVTLAETEPAEFRVVAAPSLSCVGDSGGALLLGEAGEQVLAGVISRGDSQCAEYTRGARVDVDRDGFIAGYLASTAPGTRTIGEACLYDEQCTSGLCARAIDEPRIRYCTTSCSPAGCSPPMACDATIGECRLPLPTPGAMGSACDDSDACVSLECTDTGICSRRCVADGADDCPDGYVCEHTSGINFFCVPMPERTQETSDGGCAIDRGRGSGGWVLGWLVVVWTLRRRR